MYKSSLTFKRLIVFIVFLLSYSLPYMAESCSRALWVNDLGVYVGRNMDWPNDLRTNLWVYPRGTSRDGGADTNPIYWTSKYGSVVAKGYDVIATDGMNEKGLAAHILWLNETNYGERNTDIPGLSVVMWAQYYLDNFATVEEAVAFTKTLITDDPQKVLFQVEAFESAGGGVDLHLVLDDSSGDSAIIEYINGKPRIYHSHWYTSVTNSPTYDQQLTNLRQFQGFGGGKPLPGTTASTDRFVRTAFYVSHLPHPESQSEAVAEIMSVMNNDAAPFGASSLERDVSSHTVWHTVTDLTHKVYYFQSTTEGMNLMWVSLDNFNFDQPMPEYKCDLIKNADASGDIFTRFKARQRPSMSIHEFKMSRPLAKAKAGQR